MTTRAERLPREHAGAHAPAAAVAHASDVVRYFEVAGPDYAAWSPQFNMHFGYHARGMSRFRREPMLERMNGETLALLLPDSGAESDAAGEDGESARTAVPAHVADMGCGLGATARYIARHAAHTRVTGFTIVPWQVENGRDMTEEEGLAARVDIRLADYRRTPCADASMDGAYAIESACYAGQPAKADLIAEMARIVKIGGRVVISDGFRKDSAPLRGYLGRCYRTACASWAIEGMADIKAFKQALREAGFHDVRAEEISWRVAPSFLHVPFLCVKFALSRWLRGDLRWPRERWQNLKGPLFGAILGLHRRRFGYYLVSAVRDARAKPAPREW